MGCAIRVIGALEENKVTGLCLRRRDIHAGLPPFFGSEPPEIPSVPAVVYDIAHKTGTVKAAFRCLTAPDIFDAQIFDGFIIHGCELRIG